MTAKEARERTVKNCTEFLEDEGVLENIKNEKEENNYDANFSLHSLVSKNSK